MEVNNIPLEDHRLRELYIIAKSLGMNYIKRYKKLELINRIKDRQNQDREIEFFELFPFDDTLYNNEIINNEIINNDIFELFPFDNMLYEKPKKKRAQKVKCDVCGQYIKESRMTTHKIRHNSDLDFILVESVYKSRLLTYQHNNQEMNVDIETYMNLIKEKAENLIRNVLSMHKIIKINLNMECKFQQKTDPNIKMEHPFQLENVILRKEDDLSQYWNNQKELFIARCDELEASDSQWVLESVICLRININKYTPLSGKSYIELPKWIKNKEACINVKNNDDKCFMYSILSALKTPTKDANRVSKYLKPEYNNLANFEGINFPVTIQDIPKFEAQNKINISVFSYEGKTFYPLYHNNKTSYDRSIDLLYFGNKTMNHYCWIKNLSRLLNNQLEINRNIKYFCRRCLNYATRSEEYLKKHQEICFNNEPCVPVMPSIKYACSTCGDSSNNRNEIIEHMKECSGTDRKNFLEKLLAKGVVDNDGVITIKPTLKFKNIQRMQRHPYTIYADFESLLKPIETCIPDPEKPYTIKKQSHTPCGYGLYVKSINDYDNPFQNYRGENADKHFINSITNHAKTIYKSLKSNRPIEDVQLEKHNKAKVCYLCEDEFAAENPKVKDHDHITGKYRGAACQNCNLKCKQPIFIPIVFHNLSAYDCHLFVKNLGEDHSNLSLIPSNEEKYISFTKILKMEDNECINLRFIDSYRFLASSLDTLSSNLEPNQIKETAKYFSNSDLDVLFRKENDKIIRKGIYPYEYMSSWDKFSETNLPLIDKFYSSLTKEGISQKEYNHAQKIWKYLKIENLGEWHDLYLKLDVLLLADVFENFRDLGLKSYGLDPAWYYTTPGFAWDCMLKYTKVEMDLLTDYEMYMFFEKGIRGGISQCSNRYAKADENTQLAYIDANNLYGDGLSRKLPQKDFEWMSSDELQDINKILATDDDTGYVLEADLSFPNNLHDKFNDLPLAPENRTPPGGKISKLLCHFYDKKNYVVHYKILQLYVSLGIKIDKIHRGVKFTQSNFIAPYIEFNTKQRQKAKNNFEKDFWKLLCNAVFGKSMQSVRNQQNIKLYSDEQKLQRAINKPNFKRRTIFSENLVAVHRYKTKVLFNKPIYIGQAVLDLSKLLMYDFHYNVIKKEFNNKVKLLYTDTDSLIYEFKNANFYKFMEQNSYYFDTSDYPKNHPLYSEVNKKVIGKFKDELNSVKMTEFIGLRSKMYSYRTNHSNPEKAVEKKLKGIKKAVLKKEISFEDFHTCLFESKEFYHNQTVIRSYKHNIFTEEVHKKSLSYKDDKRYLLENSTDTLAHGHYSINK